MNRGGIRRGTEAGEEAMEVSLKPLKPFAG